MSDERNLDETIVVSATTDYTDYELNQIKEALTELGYNTEITTRIRLSAFPLPEDLIFYVAKAIATGFFFALGSHSFSILKKKITEIKPRENGKSNLFFEWEIDNIYVKGYCQSDDEEVLTIFLDGLNNVNKSIEDQLKHQKLPENLKEISIEFGEDRKTWQIIGLTDTKPVEFDADSEEWKPIK